METNKIVEEYIQKYANEDETRYNIRKICYNEKALLKQITTDRKIERLKLLLDDIEVFVSENKNFPNILTDMVFTLSTLLMDVNGFNLGEVRDGSE